MLFSFGFVFNHQYVEYSSFKARSLKKFVSLELDSSTFMSFSGDQHVMFPNILINFEALYLNILILHLHGNNQFQYQID